MAHATPLLEIIPSSSIDCDDGRRPVLAAEYKEPIDNANGPDGVILLDGTGTATARIKPTPDTAANWNQVVVPDGEFAYHSDTTLMVAGNGVSYGGMPLGLNSQSSIFVAAKGTPAENAVALHDALTQAAARTPYGNALSGTNQMLVILGPGSYDLTGLAGNLTPANYVGLHGLSGSGQTIINTDTTHRLAVTQASGAVDTYSYLAGLAFTSTSSPTPDAAIAMQMTADSPNFLSLNWDDLYFAHTSSQNVMGFGSFSGSTLPLITGRVRNCRTLGKRFVGGQTLNPVGGNPVAFSVVFQNCEAGDQSFGGGSGAITDTRNGLMTGGFYNCKMTGTGLWNATLDCPMVNCEWGAAGGTSAIQRLGSNAYIRQSVVRGIVSTYSLNHSGAVNVKLRGNTLAGAIHANVTNLVTGTPDGGGNLVGETDA